MFAIFIPADGRVEDSDVDVCRGDASVDVEVETRLIVPTDGVAVGILIAAFGDAVFLAA